MRLNSIPVLIFLLMGLIFLPSASAQLRIYIGALETQIWIAISIYFLVSIIKKKLKWGPSLYSKCFFKRNPIKWRPIFLSS